MSMTLRNFRILLIAICLFQLQCSVTANPSPRKSFVTFNIKSDFGAKGDGKTNDTRAFQQAYSLINKRGGYCKLIIPSGTYIVGKQRHKYQGRFKKGASILILRNCNNVTISGNNAKLKYINGLYYGSFEPLSGKPYKSKAKNFNVGTYLADVGNAIELANCNDIKIDELEIDGNITNGVFGGKYGDTGIQARYTGVAIYDSRKVSVLNSRFHHLGLDGITIKNRKANRRLVSDDILIDKCMSNYNGRQGLSITGCIGIVIRNSEFSHTGRSAVSSSPRAGIDIEAEGEINRNITIDNCKIINNRGVGVLADRGNSSNLILKNSTVWGTTQWSLWLKMAKAQISNCIIYGSTVHAYSSTDRSLTTKYYNCQFRDTSNSHGTYLINNDGVKYILYESCSFHTRKKRAAYINSSSSSKKDYPQFLNCNFYLDVNYRIKENDYWLVWRQVRIRDCNFYFNTSKAGLQRRRFSTKNYFYTGQNRNFYNQKF